MFDGEGSVTVGKSCTKAGISQLPGPIADQFVLRMKELGFETSGHLRPSGVMGLDIAGGWPEILRTLGTLRSERLIARLQTREIERLSLRSRGNPRVKVVAVERVGVRPIQSITTTTGTYIGEGFAMHNSGDYTGQFASIDAAFDWPEPDFGELTEDGKEEIIAQVQDRPHCVLGLHIERPELRDRLAGVGGRCSSPRCCSAARCWAVAIAASTARRHMTCQARRARRRGRSSGRSITCSIIGLLGKRCLTGQPCLVPPLLAHTPCGWCGLWGVTVEEGRRQGDVMARARPPTADLRN
ncbi:hypothetical protein ACFQ2K_43735 [Streptomyces sanglieri]|uniref:GNAT-like N-terminal domain-containing protein n=1 Tax=Streptomyces sanglieri TaxID=193460 RepID=A0ABW2X3Z1_9ACTN